MKLELKYLAPYLPYGLKIFVNEWKCEREISQLKQHSIVTKDFGNHLDFKHFKPILRPLSDLTKEIECNGVKLIPMDSIIPLIEDHQTELNNPLNSEDPFKAMLDNLLSSNKMFLKLLEFHFDVFGLIEKGLAIDKNTL